MKNNRGSTPFPNILVDVFMPRLSDSSWRLLCVIVRQTVGWQSDSGSRKTEDWLSHSQLKRRTGRHSEAVSKAIQDLMDRGLINIRDDSGKRLGTAQERARASRLHFSISSGLTSLIHSLSNADSRKPKTTKQTLTKIYKAERRKHV